MNYKSLGTKAYAIGKSLGTKAFQLGPSLGSKINPVSAIGNAIIRKAVDIGTHKLMGAFVKPNCKKIQETILLSKLFNPYVLQPDECVICYDNVFTRTKCNHCVCVECAIKMRPVDCEQCPDESDDCGFNHKLCPLCKTTLYINEQVK